MLAKARSAVYAYTAGYEGKSVDAFLNELLERGIEMVIDIRANSVSRKHGFAGSQFSRLCKKLGFAYRHIPTLGISSSARKNLSDFNSYQRLLNRYEKEMLPRRSAEVEDVCYLMQRQPSVLFCVEKDVMCCHRSRLARAVAQATDLKVVHL